MTDIGPSAYDQISYPGDPHLHTHPDRLATLAALYGMTPAPVNRCRVLELGCGAGGNLIPMAYQNPESEFIGIDLSKQSLAQGRVNAAALELTNIRLLHHDIMDVTTDFGQFDYIIAHGVYSWVPATVRSKILLVFKANLAPQGVAYVSYNSSPGSHLRNLAREMMLFHVGGIADPREKIRQGRALLKFATEASSKSDIYGLVLRDQLARVNKMKDETLFHDDLDETSVSFWLHQVVEDATRHGLQYLSEAEFPRSYLGNYPQPVIDMLVGIPEHEVAARDQYLDFVVGHAFRRTLLCQNEVKLRRPIDPGCIKAYHLASALAPAENIDPSAGGTIMFRLENGDSISTDHALSKAALLQLGKAWPRALDFPTLLEDALRRLGRQADQISPDEGETLTSVLFRAFAFGHLDLHLYPSRLAAHVSARPQASRLARRQAELGPHLTNLKHVGLMLEDDIVRRLLVLAVGTRGVDDLVADLNGAIGRRDENAAADGTARGQAATHLEVSRKTVEKILGRLARLAFLVE